MNKRFNMAHWQPACPPILGKAPGYGSLWLSDPGSLTEQLLQLNNQSLEVQIVRQGALPASIGERARLQLSSHQRVLIREVLLVCHHRPWVFARTVIPWASLTGHNRKLLHLGSQSLGSTLFSDPSLKRVIKEVSIWPNLLLPAQAQSLGANWARRSIFTLRTKPILVTEVFLPHCFDQPPPVQNQIKLANRRH